MVIERISYCAIINFVYYSVLWKLINVLASNFQKRKLVWKMAFRVIRQRKEARRNAKLNEIFEVLFALHRNINYNFFKDRDLGNVDKITLEQLEDIFRIYELIFCA